MTSKYDAKEWIINKGVARWLSAEGIATAPSTHVEEFWNKNINMYCFCFVVFIDSIFSKFSSESGDF